LRHDAGDFGYSLLDARAFANKTPVGTGLAYTHEQLPTFGSGDGIGSFRGGSSSYAYTPAQKVTTYYPSIPPYGTPYPEDFAFALGVPGTSASPLSTEAVPIIHGQWSSTARPKYSNMYMDPEGPYGSYSNNNSSMLQRTQQPLDPDSSGLSFPGVAASLPLPSTPAPDRLLPNLAGRPSPLQYTPGPAGPNKAAAHSSVGGSTLADVSSSAASYTHAFDASGLPYETDRVLDGQSSALDMSAYTTSGRRESVGGAGTSANAREGTSATRPQGAGSFVSGGNISESASHHDTQGHSDQHHNQQRQAAESSYMRLNETSRPGSATSSAQSILPGVHLLATGCNNLGGHNLHMDERPSAVVSRH
jgi:hypothetical protein